MKRLLRRGFVSKIQKETDGIAAGKGAQTMWYKFKCAMARFMYGRNGMDQLNQALFRLYLAVWLVGSLLGMLLKSEAVNLITSLLTWVLFIALFFRMFSKNLYKRRAENQKWVNWMWKQKNDRAGAKARHADKEHKYFTCKSCKAICRVPVGKGKIIITCPKCGAQIEART